MKTIFISAKVIDRFNLSMYDGEEEIIDYRGYVPNVQCIGGDDYFDIEVDENGQILNWDKDCFKKILEAMKGEEEE